jgi:DNA-binding NtrC family response regulator
MLIVTDRLADERLWAEVLNLGGYDLLLKPFDPEELLRVVSSAWASWKFSRDGSTAGGGSAKRPSPEQPKAPIGDHSPIHGPEGIKSHA